MDTFLARRFFVIALALLALHAFGSTNCFAHAAPAPLTPNIVTAPRPDVPSKPSPKYVADTKNIIKGSAKSYTVTESRSNVPRLLDVSDAVTATDIRDDSPITKFLVSSPRLGTTISTHTGRMLYVVPRSVGVDTLKVQAVTKDGIYDNFRVTIRIVPRSRGGNWSSASDSDKSVPAQRVARLRLTSATVNGYMCDLQGTWPSHDGEVLDLVVETQYGVTYLQSSHPTVANSHFAASVYIGDEVNGRGETFTIWATHSSTGVKSNVMTVRRPE